MFNIETIKKEYDELLQKLSNAELISDWEKGDKSKDSSSPFAGARVFEELLKKKDFLEKIIEKEKELTELKKKIEENKSILKSQEDQELFSLAEAELTQLTEKQKFLEEELKKILSEEKSAGPQAIIVEIRAGTGGKEAALFADDLFKMYSKYAQLKSWKQKILNSSPTETGGFKEIVFELRNGDVFSQFQYEAGVHRVQRIPSTEKSGRIHTSTATVAVLPKPKKTEMKIRPDDLKIDFYHASGPGGQNVNKRMTAVRITHLPSGLFVTSQSERSQFQNKENALSILEAKLLERKETDEIEKIEDKRKSQIGRAKRAEKIRTYNFPQDRVTDHRIKKSFHHIEEIMAGELNNIFEALKNNG